MTEARSRVVAGGFFATGAFLLWGLLPIYWKTLVEVPVLEILCHRVVWSSLFLLAVILVLRRSRILSAMLLRREARFALLGTMLLLSINWYTFVHAIQANLILDASLGYYTNPLFNVLLGFVFLKERPRRLQWLAIALATAGVLNLTMGLGRFPWIALVLASTFGFYALLRKAARIDAICGLWVESTAAALVASGWLVSLHRAGEGTFLAGPLSMDLLLIAAGLATAMPLLLFGAAAHRLTLTTVGFFQYLAPTCQFLVAVFLYGEVFTSDHQITFALIWIAIVIYSLEGAHASRTLRTRVTG